MQYRYFSMALVGLSFVLSFSLVCMDDEPEYGIYWNEGQKGRETEVFRPYVDKGNDHKIKIMLALIPMPGYSVPRHLQLTKYLNQQVDKDAAPRACTTYSRNPLFSRLFSQLQQGELVRVLLHGGTGVGKNFLAQAFPQESGVPYDIALVQCASLLSTWHNSEYEGMKDVFKQAIDLVEASGKKLVLIVNDIETLDSCKDDVCHDEPVVLGSQAVSEFFDRQDRGDLHARNISMIALTDAPERISPQTSARFFGKIFIDRPDATARHDIILACIAENRDKTYQVDESVIQHTRELADMTDFLNAWEINKMFVEAVYETFKVYGAGCKTSWNILQKVAKKMADEKKAEIIAKQGYQAS